MFKSDRKQLLAIVALCTAIAGVAQAQNHAPNPYRTVEGWATLPEGREWGATSAVYPANDGKHIWIAERCGANLCVGSDVDPVMLFDQDGKVVKKFGGGQIVWPHGIYVDDDDNVWIADAVGYAPVPDGVGHTVMKFSPDGELLMTLGKEGEAGPGPDTFNKPSDMLVAPNGDIFVADGHDAGGNNRIVKFDKDGNYLGEWGTTGDNDGQFRDPHALAMDSRGRLFVADRGNSRLQIFDQGASTSRPGPSSGVPAACSSMTRTYSIRPIRNRTKNAIPAGSAASASVARRTVLSRPSFRTRNPTRTTPAPAAPKALPWMRPAISTGRRSARAPSRNTSVNSATRAPARGPNFHACAMGLKW